MALCSADIADIVVNIVVPTWGNLELIEPLKSGMYYLLKSNKLRGIGYAK